MPRPVVIVSYDPRWPGLYEQEKAGILAAIADRLAAIEHIGSTAVPGLGAKPTIDILAGLKQLADAERCISPLATIGYEYYPENQLEIPGWHYFDRKDSEGTGYHLHMVEMGCEFWQRHLLFRDYLRSHPETAQEYERLKRELAAQHGSDRMAYCNAKTDFVHSVEVKARAAKERE